MKLLLIKILDWIDEKIIGHRSYWLCNKIANSEWWGEEVDVEFTNEEFIELAIEAHYHDITFNKLCENILSEYVNKNKK